LTNIGHEIDQRQRANRPEVSNGELRRNMLATLPVRTQVQVPRLRKTSTDARNDLLVRSTWLVAGLFARVSANSLVFRNGDRNAQESTFSRLPSEVTALAQEPERRAATIERSDNVSKYAPKSGLIQLAVPVHIARIDLEAVPELQNSSARNLQYKQGEEQ
jgi:hypothetical protein